MNLNSSLFTRIKRLKVHTVLVDKEFKAILSENLNVLYEYIFTDSCEVKLLRAANIKGKNKNRSLTSKKGYSKQQEAKCLC